MAEPAARRNRALERAEAQERVLSLLAGRVHRLMGSEGSSRT